MNFENEFQIKYHKVLMMNELGDHTLSEDIPSSAFKLSLCKKGNSGYSFGPCQWDLSNPNRKITNNIKVIDLYEKIISNYIKDENIIETIKNETLNHKLKPLSKLKYLVSFEGRKVYLLDLIDKCLETSYSKEQIRIYYLEEIKEQIEYIDERIKDILNVNPKIKEFLEDEYIRLSLLDFHNQFNFSKNGKCEKYLKGQKTQKYNSSSSIEIVDGKTKEEWTNFYYYSTKYGCENRKNLERRQANIEKIEKFKLGKKEETKAPQSFQEALKIMFPKMKISKDRLLSTSWVGYKFTNLYQLTSDECKKDEAEIIRIAQNKYKDDKKNLNIIKRGSLYQVLLKAGEYEGVIAKDSKEKEQNFFYNNEEENKIFGSVKLAYGHSYNGINFIKPTIYSPINGKVCGKNDNCIIVEEIHNNMEEVKYLHYFSNVANLQLSIGTEIKLGAVLGQVLQASKDSDDINLTYSINKVDVKASNESTRIDPVEFWNSGKHIGVPMERIAKGLKLISMGKFGTIKENDNSKKETWTMHDLGSEDGREFPVIVDGYKIGHYAKKTKEYAYEEKEMIFNRKDLKLENKGFSIGYEYLPLDKTLVVRAQSKPKLNIKNFSDGDHGIHLPGIVTKGLQLGLYTDEDKEESSSTGTSVNKGSGSGSGSQKYVGTGAKACCTLGGQITLMADKSSIFSMGKMLLHGAHTKSMGNLLGAGTCNISSYPPPCIPSPTGQWLQTSPKFKIDGQPALTDKSTIMCAKGGKITITSTGQSTISYGSIEAQLLFEKAKDDEKTEKNQKEGKKEEPKIKTVVTVLNKVKMEEYKKAVEVEVFLTLEEYYSKEKTYNNKKFNLYTGKLLDENNNKIISLSWRDKKISEGKHDFIFNQEEKKLTLGEFTIANLENKDKFYKTDNIMGTEDENYFG